MVAVLRDGIDDPNDDPVREDFLWIQYRPVTHNRPPSPFKALVSTRIYFFSSLD